MGDTMALRGIYGMFTQKEKKNVFIFIQIYFVILIQCFCSTAMQYILPHIPRDIFDISYPFSFSEFPSVFMICILLFL